MSSEVPTKEGSCKKSMNIILIDDDADVLSALEMIFVALGHNVSSFSSPNIAISEIKKNYLRYDVVLCDLIMGDIDGIKVLREIRKVTQELPFILMSANASTKDINSAKTLGRTEFIEKPTVHLSFMEAYDKLRNSPFDAIAN